MEQVDRGRPRRPQFPGNRKRFAAGTDTPPPLQLGEHGELTYKTIAAAGLTGEEKKRAQEMLKVQAAYLQILDCLSYPVDPEGHVHDLSALGPTKVAIAWTLALNGARFSGRRYIKKRHFTAPGCYADAHTWVDIRAADNAVAELVPEDHADDPALPPDTRRLAAIRDGAAGQQMPDGWHVAPKITEEWVDRDTLADRRRP